jgi:glycosyltransferase involved in cell wall biosynthesis
MLNYEYPPLGGGAAPATRELALSLSEYHAVSIDVVTMGFEGLPKCEDDNGVTVHRVPCLRSSKPSSNMIEMGSYLPTAIYRSIKLLRENEYDIIHSHFILPTGIIGAIINSVSDSPHVITSHGSDVPNYNPDDYKIPHKFLSPVSKKILQNTNTVVTPSKYLQNLIYDSFDIDSLNSCVIPYGFYPDKIKPREKYRNNILLASRLLKRKGFQRVLEAVGRIDTELTVRIAGEGSYKERLTEIAESIEHEVEFLGWLEGDELFEEYSRSEIFVLPSTSDNYPVSIMEAMAGGNAVVTAQDSGCAEVVGDTGVLVDPEDTEQIKEAIDSLLNDEERRRTLQHAARSRIEEELSWKSISAQHVELYESLVEAKR